VLALLKIMCSLILNTSYNMKQEAININVGLCPFKNNGEYPIKIEIISILFESISQVDMSADEFFILQNALDILTSQSSIYDFEYSLEQKLRNILLHRDETQFDLEVGDYIVTFFIKTNIIRFSNKNTFMISKSLLDLSFANWYFIKMNFSSAVKFKVSFLKKYSQYARIVHDKLVKYYFDKLINTKDFYLNLDFVKTHILSLETCSLPRSDLKCDYKNLDYDVCFVSDSEIRLFAASAIFAHVYGKYTKFYSVSNEE